jgi:bifunctional pyridoxal-dependent enzyme with beta-cystathionase and maltose regulon repressor activities
VSFLSQEGLTVNDGSTFGRDFQGFIRFNIACSFSQLAKGTELLIAALKKMEKNP